MSVPMENENFELELVPAESSSENRTETESSSLLRFFDNFLQERNIRWMLALGMLILFGSSLTLVRANWEGLGLAERHLVILGYTGIVGFLGYWSNRRLGLRKTGTVLHALTVLLIPLTFVAWHLMRSDTAHAPPAIVTGGLLVVNLAAAAVGSHFIFQHLLRTSQPTFVACYLLLAFAGAIVPALSASWWPVTGLALWATFAIGSVKVNRHVFWLTEERQLPRIFGFFPIALLGTQFLLLSGFTLGPTIWATHREWLGLACMLTAVPILLTADAVAKVFEQRTGNLVRPLPWSIVLPLFTGLALSFIGLAVSAMGLPFPTALVPTALIFALMMGLAARRTGKSVFVWFALISLSLSYNFSYTLVNREVIEQAKGTAARAIRADRLPIAYYGLTYLPLLFGLTVGSRLLARRGDKLFAQPIRKYVIGLACLLQIVAFTHVKAIFPVSLALTLLFVVQAVCFRDRRLLLPAVVAYFAASFGFGAYLETVMFPELMQQIPYNLTLCWPTLAAGLLLIGGGTLDRLAARIPVERPLPQNKSTRRRSAELDQDATFEQQETAQPRFLSIVSGADPGLFRHASWIVTLLISAAWCSQAVLHGTPNWLAQARVSEFFIGGLLVAQALVRKDERLGAASLAFAGFGLVTHWIIGGIALPWACVYSTLMLAGLWVVAGLLKTVWIPRVSAVYGRGAELCSSYGLSLLTVFTLFDLTANSISQASCHGSLASLTSLEALALWGSRLAIVIWAFDAARVKLHGGLSCLGTIGLLGIVSAALTSMYGMQVSFQWIPLAWTLTSIGMMTVLIPLARRQQLLESVGELQGDLKLRVQRLNAITAPLDFLIPGLLLFIGAYSLLVPVQFAGGIAAGALLWLAIRIKNYDVMRLACVLLNWQAMLFLVRCCLDDRTAQTLLDLRPQGLLQNQVVLVIALLCTASARIWTYCLQRLKLKAKTDGTSETTPTWMAEFAQGALIPIHITLMNCLTAFLLIVSIGYALGQYRVSLPAHEVVALMATYGWLTVGQIRDGIRKKSEESIWAAEGLVGVMFVHMLILGLLNLSMGLSVYTLMGAGFVLWGIGHAVRNDARFSVLSRPFLRTGFVLPAFAIGWAIARRVLPGHRAPAVESFTLLLPAAFYFWRGLEEHRAKLTVFAIALFNLTLALLWHDLKWTDPQLYLMPAGLSILALVKIMSNEIPRDYHTPLRYVGALCILVSPTFQLVQGSWLHIATLLVASVTVVLLGIGLRIRPFLYCGAAFMIADLIAMVVFGAMQDKAVLWISGIAVGTFVLMLGAYFERRREHLLQRLRVLSAQLESWK